MFHVKIHLKCTIRQWPTYVDMYVFIDQKATGLLVHLNITRETHIPHLRNEY